MTLQVRKFCQIAAEPLPAYVKTKLMSFRVVDINQSKLVYLTVLIEGDIECVMTYDIFDCIGVFLQGEAGLYRVIIHQLHQVTTTSPSFSSSSSSPTDTRTSFPLEHAVSVTLGRDESVRCVM